MKYHPLLKGLAIFLAACMLILCAVSVFGIIVLSNNGLYTSNLQDYQEFHQEEHAMILADHLLNRYTATVLGHCSPDSLAYLNFDFTEQTLSEWYSLDPAGWDYSIKDASGNIVEDNYSARLQRNDTFVYSFHMSCDYPVEVTGDELYEFNNSGYSHQDYYTWGTEEIYLFYYQSPEYTVTIRMLPNTVIPDLEQLSGLYEVRYWLIGTLLAGLVIFALCAVYLCFAAGRSSDGSSLNPKGLNRLPLDLYLIGACLICAGGVYVACEALDNWLWRDGLDLGILVLALCLFLAVAVVGIAFCFAAAAQFKMGNGWWWKNTLIGRIFRFIAKCVRSLFRLLPLMWQWLLIGAAMGFFSLFFFFLLTVGRGFWIIPFFLSLLGNIVLICYGAYAFGLLQKGAKQMAEGDLHAKIPTQYLFGAFRDFADRLNALSDAATVAAKNEMKAERMKTELITNVSHDIKTPLTSIINYVDLLEKPHTDEEEVQYLDVLSRQSQRLKKLIDDLMEMSKASTGNMATNIISLNLAEAVNQALGEFSDKLEQAQLTVVFRPPEQPVMVEADGRLTWRVLSNLLSNTVKYALPGTRVYLDIKQENSKVLLSLKNISREELNTSADELTERFVRGDASRNTEGSGLGLNIAKSLMQLQKGNLDLFVDGDLFKVTLTFFA